MNIVVASYNPAKLQAVANGFNQVFPQIQFTHTPVSVLSQVSLQPLSDSETKKGSVARAQNAKQLYPKADFWVGIEGGIHKYSSLYQAFAWVTIIDSNLQNSTRTATFTLPANIVTEIKDGTELGDAIDKIYHKFNSKQNEGAVGVLTNGLINRTQLYQQAIILCLSPFLSFYPANNS